MCTTACMQNPRQPLQPRPGEWLWFSYGVGAAGEGNWPPLLDLQGVGVFRGSRGCCLVRFIFFS